MNGFYENKPQFLNDEKYKTALCRNFVQYGDCSYGQKCRFAHGEQELQQGSFGGGFNQNPGFMNQQQNFPGNNGFMPMQGMQDMNPGFNPMYQQGSYGDNRPQGVCRFFMEQGQCRFGDSCKFSHNFM